MFDVIDSLWRRLSHEGPLAVLVELALIGLVVNWCVGMLRGTRGSRLFRGVLVVLVVATLAVRVLSEQMGWARLDLLYRFFVFGVAFMALVAFQPEIRRAFIRVGDVRFLRRGSPQSRLIGELVESAGFLSRNKYGALIAIEREVGLRGWAENGTLLNADVSAGVLNTIFFPKSPLHDLGVIIRGTRILAASCQFPQAESEDVPPGLGSRHRAAVGLSYESDALVIVVSEETGAISLADGGELHRHLTLDGLSEELTRRLAGIAATDASSSWRIRSVSDLWRYSRRALLVLPLTVVIWYLADQASQIQSVPIAVELKPVCEQADQRVAEILQPQPAVFRVVFRGSTRAVERLREQTAEKPLQVDWVIRQNEQAEGEFSRDVRSVLVDSREIASRGVGVVSAVPATFDFAIDSLVTERFPVSVDSGPVNVSDVQIEPPDVEVTLPRRQLARLRSGQKLVRVPLASRLAEATADQPLTFESVALSTRVGDVTAAAIRPTAARVSLRIVGKVARRVIKGVRVQWLVPESVQSRFEVNARDPNELIVDVSVEGDRALIESLTADQVLAFVNVTPELFSPSGAWQSATVELSLPAGVTTTGKRPDVQLRLIERTASTP